ncbi:MAG: hypothetical protein ACRDY0_04895 [Acidimicrobiales bacterium]
MGGPFLIGRRVLGTVPDRLGAREVRARLKALGPAGQVAATLDRRVVSSLSTVAALSELTSALAVAYVERVARPVTALSAPAGAHLVVTGYLAHLLVEEDPAGLGVDDIPVLGNLPPLRRGRPPQDLLNRVVKATRRDFETICALPPATWDGFVTATTAHVHHDWAGARGSEPGAAGAGFLDPSVADGLLRTGWVLRQVDLAYGLQPERRWS